MYSSVVGVSRSSTDSVSITRSVFVGGSIIRLYFVVSAFSFDFVVVVVVVVVSGELEAFETDELYIFRRFFGTGLSFFAAIQDGRKRDGRRKQTSRGSNHILLLKNQ